MYLPVNKSEGLVGTLAVKRVKDFTFSNTIGIVEEVQRYKEIADYFASKGSRERYNSFNSKYLDEMHGRLLAIQEESLPEQVLGLCSKLLKRFDAGII